MTMRFILNPTEGTLFEYVTEKAQEKAKEELKEEFKNTIYTFLEAAGETAVELLEAFTLIGGGILLILRVAGMKQGSRWCALLYCTNALVRVLMGGAI
jgi:diacylglycerol kinase family enzyme